MADTSLLSKKGPPKVMIPNNRTRSFGKINIFTVAVVVFALILNPHTLVSNSEDYLAE